jgi:SAM-dependent methyltransferase
MIAMDFIDKNPFLSALNYGKGQMFFRLGLRGHRSGSTARGLAIGRAVSYIREVAEDYVQYGAMGDVGRVQGKRILEIGPGDNLGVGLMLLAMGAESVTALDGFTPAADPEKNREIYAALCRLMTEEQRERIRDVIREDPDGGVTIRGERLIAHYASPLEAEPRALPLANYDIILSRAVLEHLADVRKGWAAMVRSLRPGGEMWHKVDFRPHHFFERIHPLYFLTFNERLWRMISSPDPTLNRARLPVYRELTAKDFESSTIFYTHILDEGEVKPHPEKLVPGAHYLDRHVQSVKAIRPRLTEPFAGYADEDLLVAGAFVISRRKHPSE